MQKVLCLVFFVFVLGCASSKKGDDTQPQPEPKPQPQPQPQPPPTETSKNPHIIMMIDAGIDPNHDAYKDRVLASYTLDCGSSKKSDSNGHTSKQTPEEVKENLLKELAGPEVVLWGPKCELKPGINTHIPSPPGDVLALRDRWNDFIRGRAKPTRELRTVFDYLKNFSGKFHGTNTTALVAYKNPDVRFILVERELGGGGGSKKTDCEALAKQAPYFDIFADAKVQQALIDKAELSDWKVLDQAAKKHKVTMVNKSYGMTKYIIIKSLEADHCDRTSIEHVVSYFESTAKITDGIAKRMGIFYDSEPFLTLQAAGNEGSRVDSTADTSYCPKASHHIEIGSYDVATGQLSSFSNFGECVDLYSLGSSVITSNPNNFLNVLDGTSFSTPLSVRYISFEFSSLLDPAKLRLELLKHLDAKGFLPPNKHFTYATWKEPLGLNLSGQPFSPVIHDNSTKIDRHAFDWPISTIHKGG